jgi:hypothetical protein
MTVTGTGEQLRSHTGRVKDPLLSCLSRLILEPDLIEPHYAAITSNRGVVDSASISRAIIQETLSFREVQSTFTAPPRVPIQARALSHR